eukprot:TRINITY_DN66758_c4_g5_i1.p2 TRINITY_DN66758_c4_g5~~TRINITY_DN66758_c4_g5_i1.p2  ORF type:complete len:101 (-),score=15.91 TRINITY_DN66758_c4_g5_i1:423-725(-)
MIDATKAALEGRSPAPFDCIVANIESEPREDLLNVADVALSNGVINLTKRKDCALKYAFKILKNGGTFQFSDVCITPEPKKSDLDVDKAPQPQGEESWAK